MTRFYSFSEKKYRFWGHFCIQVIMNHQTFIMYTRLFLRTSKIDLRLRVNSFRKRPPYLKQNKNAKIIKLHSVILLRPLSITFWRSCLVKCTCFSLENKHFDKLLDKVHGSTHSIILRNKPLIKFIRGFIFFWK